MPDLLAGTTILAQDWPESVEVDEATDLTNLSNASYEAGSTVASVTFQAPTTGRVSVSVYGRLQSTGSDRILLSWEMYEGGDASGTLVVSAADNNGVSETTSSIVHTGSADKLVSDLTPGVTHFIRAMHRVTGGTTANVFHRRLIVKPAS